MLDTATFLTTVYTLLDDLSQAELAPLRARTMGRRPRVSDSDVLTLALLGHWYRLSERALLRRAQSDWRGFFPDQLSQSAFNRRVRGLATVFAWLVPRLAAELGGATARYEILDGVSVPLERCCRGATQRLLGADADFGKGGSEKRWYYGCKLLLSVTPQGVITGFVAGPASTEERWLAEALLSGRQQPDSDAWCGSPVPAAHRSAGKRYSGPTGPVWPRLGLGVAGTGAYLADCGYTGAWWTGHWRADYSARVVTPWSYTPEDTTALRAHAGLRQIVETANAHLKEDLALEYLGARSRWGLRARLAAKLSMLNLAMLLNQRAGRPLFALATLAA